MLQPSNDDIDFWLSGISQSSGFPLRQIEYGHWQLDMSNSEASFTLDIFDQGEWITYGTVLMHDVQGHGRVNFYEYLLQLDGRLNGAKIGLENGFLTLTTEDRKEGFDWSSLGRSLDNINMAHQKIFQQILDQANDLNLRFKSW